VRRFLFSRATLACLALAYVVASCGSGKEKDLCKSITGQSDGLHVSNCPKGYTSLSLVTSDATGAKTSYAFAVTCGDKSVHGLWSQEGGLQCIEGAYLCEAGVCAPTSAADCAVSPNCEQLGECAYVDGKCVLSEDGCTHSEISCGLSGACHLGGDGKCAVTSDADCQGSCVGCTFEGPCATSGNCYQQSGACVARQDADCKKAEQCAFAGKCTLVGQACAAATDADCAASEVCRTAGQCAAIAGTCGVK
jgi:hypothetical protein